MVEARCCVTTSLLNSLDESQMSWVIEAASVFLDEVISRCY